MANDKYYVTVDNSGSTRWYKDTNFTILHRENGPAVEYTSGTKFWYQDGRLHHTDGPAIEYADGDKWWYQGGQLHRIDGPAIVDERGSKHWFQNNQLHRIDGPAVEYANGEKFWYINGEELCEAEFLAATQPVVEMTVAEVEKLLGKRVKIVK